MSRRPSSSGSTVSLFPFLAVLVCAMGALILLLLAITQQMRAQAQASLAPMSVPQPAIEAPTPSGPSADDLAAVKARRQQWRLAWLKKLEEEKAARHHKAATVAQQQQTLSEAEQKIAAAEAGLEVVQARQMLLTSEERRLAAAAAHLSIEEDEIKRQEALTRRNLEHLRKRKSTATSQYALVPYDGASGTVRRPIYIECTAKGLRILPEDVLIGPKDLQGFTESYNPLLLGTQSLVRYWENRRRFGNHPDEPEPYVLLLVRPSGTVAYYLARKLLTRLKTPFGYELVEEGWELKLPEPDPGAQEVVRQAVDSIIATRDNVRNDVLGHSGGRGDAARRRGVVRAIPDGEISAPAGSRGARGGLDVTGENGSGGNGGGSAGPEGDQLADTRNPYSGIGSENGANGYDIPPSPYSRRTTARPDGIGLHPDGNSEGGAGGTRPALRGGENAGAATGTGGTGTGGGRRENRSPGETGGGTGDPGSQLAKGGGGFGSGEFADPRLGRSAARPGAAGQPGGQPGRPPGDRPGGMPGGKPGVVFAEESRSRPAVRGPATFNGEPLDASEGSSEGDLSAGDSRLAAMERGGNNSPAVGFGNGSFNNGGDNGGDALEPTGYENDAEVGQPGESGTPGEPGTQRPIGTYPGPATGNRPPAGNARPGGTRTAGSPSGKPADESVPIDEAPRGFGRPGGTPPGSRGDSSPDGQAAADGSAESQTATGGKPSGSALARGATPRIEDLPEKEDGSWRGSGAPGSEPGGTLSNAAILKELSRNEQAGDDGPGSPLGGNAGPRRGRDHDNGPVRPGARRWGKGRGTIGLEKPLEVHTYPDRVQIGSDITVLAGRGETRDELVSRVLNGIDQCAETWGEPPARFYWVPAVKFVVHPGSNQHYERLQSPLREWGIKSTVDYGTGAGSQTRRQRGAP